jgi:hypothetical protein
MNKQPEINQLSPIQYEIIRQIVAVLDKLGASVGVFAALGSWGDTLPEEDVFCMLKAENERLEKERAS